MMLLYLLGILQREVGTPDPNKTSRGLSMDILEKLGEKVENIQTTQERQKGALLVTLDQFLQSRFLHFVSSSIDSLQGL